MACKCWAANCPPTITTRVYFTSATNLMIANCDIHDNTYYGIYGGGYGVIRSNRVYRTDYYEAIRVWGGPLLVEGNQVFQNDSTGIAGTTLVTCRGNTVFSNGADGIYVEGGAASLSEAIENRVFLNGLAPTAAAASRPSRAPTPDATSSIPTRATASTSMATKVTSASSPTTFATTTATRRTNTTSCSRPTTGRPSRV